MTELILRLALPLALAVNPLLFTAIVSAGPSTPVKLAWTGAGAVALNVIVPMGLHLGGIPITGVSLASAHWMLFFPLLLGAIVARRHEPIRRFHDLRWPILIAGGLALLTMPVTPLAGIDTYKWQDLATAVRVDGCIPWLVHPLSLTGFTPRSYPSAQPLLLATAQMLGGLGVGGGFFVVSLFSITLGSLSAYALGTSLFDSRKASAGWFTFLYVFSPVFVRYNHWATGRGLCLALLPLFVLCLIRVPDRGAVAGAIACGVLLALCHKAGLVAAVLLPLAAASAVLVPRHAGPRARAIVVCLFLGAGLLFAPALEWPQPLGRIAGMAWLGLSRFGWMLPVAVIGLVCAIPLQDSRWRRLVPAALLGLPPAFAADMYGAMIALPFVVLATTCGLDALERRVGRPRWLPTAVCIATVACAAAVVVRRSLNATPRRVRAAAVYIESLDPQGPFRIEGPGRTPGRMQAYVSGCPRFRVTRGESVGFAFRPLPPTHHDLRRAFREWIRYLRAPFALHGVETSWYGDPDRVYRVRIDGQGPPSEGGTPIYARDGVEVFAFEEKAP